MIKEFDINELRAEIGKSIHRMKIVNFYYGDDCCKVPNIRVYGGMKVVKGKSGKFFELDIKDDEAEEFFKLLVEQLRMLAGIYLDEKPWNLKSPVVEYVSYYSVHCKILSCQLVVGECFRGYCEIEPYHAFHGKTKGITLAVNKIV